MNARSGLSLFELLVALALLALITTGLASALGMAVQVWKRAEILSTQSEEVALRSRLRVWLEQATPPSRLTPFPNAMIGTSDSLTFVTLAETPFAPDAAGLRVVVSTTGDALTLTAIFFNDEGAEISRIEGDLARKIEPRLSYFDSTAESPEWRNSWDDANALPMLIRIDAPKGSEPDWPEFVVRLLLR